MNWDELESKIVIQNQSFLLSQGMFTKSDDEWLNQCFSNGMLKMTDASKEEVDNKITVKGKTTAFNVENAETEASFSLDTDGNVCIVVKIQLDPQTWSFLTSFPNLPGGRYCRLLDISYSESELLISNVTIENYEEIALYRGVNFCGTISSSPLMSFVQKKTGVYPIIYGHIDSDNTKEMNPLSWGEFPYDYDLSKDPPPGFVFTVKLLDYSSFSIQDVVNFSDICLRIYFPPDAVFVKKNPTYHPRYAFYGQSAIPVIELHSECWVNYVPDTVEFGLILNTNFSLETLGNITKLFGNYDAAGALPEALKNTQLNKFTLSQLALDFDLAEGSPRVNDVMVTVGLPGAEWGILDDQYKIGNLSSTFLYVPEKDGMDSRFDVSVSGDVTIKDKTVAVRAVKTNDFTIYLDLKDPISLSLEDYIKLTGLDIPVPTPLTINTVNGEISSSNHVQITARMASDGDKWIIPLGPVNLEMSDVSVYCRYDFAGKDKEKGNFAGCFSGTVALDDFRLTATYDFPGKASFLMYLPDFSLVKLIDDLCGDKVLLPDGFDICLTRSTILLEKGDGDQFDLSLATLVNGFGFLMFKVVRNGAETGYVFGLNIDGKKMSEVKGFSFLKALDVFQLDKLVFVASTVDDNNFAFPGAGEFKVDVYKDCSVRLPMSGGIKKGLNFYAEWELDTTKQEQKLLKGLLQLQAAIAMKLIVQTNGDALLAAGCVAKIAGRDVAMEFGCALSGGNIAFYAKGQFEVIIQKETQNVTLELGFNEGGAYGAATLSGDHPIDFKWFQLGNLALQIGVDWEGVPSLGVAGTLTAGKVNASAAVLFDSTQPEKSMVAGSLSDLSLADVFDAFLEPDSVSVVRNNESLTDIRDILETFNISGTGAFELPIDMTEAFDNANMDEISDAFAKNGITGIPKVISQVFYSKGNVGKDWFFTAFTDNKVVNYQIHKVPSKETGEDVLRVSKQAQLYAVPVDTRIGEIPFAAGFSISGRIQLYDFWLQAEVNIDSKKGLSFEADMSKIEVGNGLVCIAGVDETGTKPSNLGPHLKFDTSQETFAEASAYVSILDIENSCKFEANKSGFAVVINHDSELASLNITSTLKGLEHFDFSIAARILENKVSLFDPEKGSFIGNLILQNGADGTIALTVDSLTQISFVAAIHAKLLGKDYSIADIDISLDLKTIAEVIKCMLKKYADYIAKLVWDDVVLYAALFKQKFIDGFTDVMDALAKVFNKIGDEAIEIIKKAEELINNLCAVTKAVDKLSYDDDAE